MDIEINNICTSLNNFVVCDKGEYEYLTRCKILLNSILSEAYKHSPKEYIHFEVGKDTLVTLFPEETQSVKDYFKNEYGKEVEFSDF